MQLSKLRIKVSERDIAQAVPRNSHICAVATAVGKAIPDALRVDVDNQTIRFSMKDRRLVYLTPWQVSDYITAFDAGDPIEPFEFIMRNPQVTKRTKSSIDEQKLRKELRAAGKPAPRSTRRMGELEQLVADLPAAVREVDEPAHPGVVADLPAAVREVDEPAHPGVVADLPAAVREVDEPALDPLLTQDLPARAQVLAIPSGSGFAYTRIGGSVPPRARAGYRTRTRVYGARVMRVNRERFKDEVPQA